MAGPSAAALSLPNALEIDDADDIVHQFSGMTSGFWTFTIQQYIPSASVNGSTYVILLNDYVPDGVVATNNWSTQVEFNLAASIVEAEIDALSGGPSLPMIRDQWVEFRVEIDLDNNAQSIYYGGTLLTSYDWSPGVTLGGQSPPLINIAALDLFAAGPGVDAVYYDDVSLCQIPVLSLVPDSTCYSLAPTCGDCAQVGAGPGCSDPVCEAIVCAFDSFCCTNTWDSICAGEALQFCDCGPPTQIILDVLLQNAPDLIVGGDFFLEYDNTVLDFLFADPGDSPFVLEVFESVDEIAGTIDYSVGVDFPDPGTMADTVMARLTFDVIGLPAGDPCAIDDLVTWRAHVPPTQLTNFIGTQYLPDALDMTTVTIDGTPPDITCPPDVTLECGDLVQGLIWDHKMHYPQRPNEEGWDVSATWPPKVLADDWLCTETGPVSDIHFWGSWREGIEGQIIGFNLSIHANIPAGDIVPWSVPGPLLWSIFIEDFGFTPIDPPTMQGWFDPPGAWNFPDHQNYFRYDVQIPPGFEFIQQEGEIYWLDISAVIVDPVTTHWGWKTAIKGFEDDAVWVDNPAWPIDPPFDFWQELFDPITGESLDMAFVITDGPPMGLGVATATDNCDTNPLITFTDSFSGCGNCNVATGLLGCSDPVCEGIVCAIDDFCCNVAWDSICADLAFLNCNCDGCGNSGVITRTWTATDFCGNSASCDQIITIVDTQPPIIVGCPPDITVDAEAGGCTAVVSWIEPRAYDACCCLDSFEPDFPPGFEFPEGDTLVTYTATDCCGNVSTCSFTVTVNPVNNVVVDIDLDGAGFSSPITRCITYFFRGVGTTPDYTVSRDVVFTAGSATDPAPMGTFTIPCGNYDCMLVTDELHTLVRKSDDFTDAGTIYTGSVVNPDGLLSGNFNNDPWIDILDFGTFVGLYDDDNSGGPVSTPCGTAPPDADVNGDGDTDGMDFAFLQINYLDPSEDCTSTIETPWPIVTKDAGPITRISVGELARRGLEKLTVADLNHDGWLDEKDIVAFMNGVRP